MKEINFYPGIYKLIALAICLIVFITINRAQTQNCSSEKNSYSSNISLLTQNNSSLPN